MRLAIMQPYLFPYIGYFQLMNAVDEFVIYDNIEFTKKGWINRNRILVNGADDYITLPLKKGSDYLQVRQRQLADTWPAERKKIMNRITESYRKAPFFSTIYPALEGVFLFEDCNLFNFIYQTVQLVKEYLGINTHLIVSSAVPVDHTLKSQDKVIEICKSCNAGTYINPIGGLELYSKDVFGKAGLKLKFIKSGEIKYKQFSNDFIPWLSIIDVMMFNSKEEIKKMLEFYNIE